MVTASVDPSRGPAPTSTPTGGADARGLRWEDRVAIATTIMAVTNHGHYAQHMGA